MDRQNVTFRFSGGEWQIGSRPLIMGILNVTPDSFSDGGLYLSPDRAVDKGLAMVAQGADTIDVGGESTRPGAPEVRPEEEIRRVCPIVRALAAAMDIPISVDTRKSIVAEAALSEGASIVNDVSGLRFDDNMAATVARFKAGYIGMHMRGIPATMQSMTDYDNIMLELKSYFRAMIQAAQAKGIGEDHIMIDPGIGFGKTAEQNLLIIHRLAELADFGRPVLIGVSRKSFIGKITQVEEPCRRIWGTAAAVAVSVYNSAHVVRVHDVEEMRQVCALAAAVRDAD